MVTQRARPLPSLAKARRKVNFYRFLRPLNDREDVDVAGGPDGSEDSDDESRTHPAKRMRAQEVQDELTNPWSNVTTSTLGQHRSFTLREWQRRELGQCCFGHDHLLPDEEASMFADGVTVNSHPERR